MDWLPLLVLLTALGFSACGMTLCWHDGRSVQRPELVGAALFSDATNEPSSSKVQRAKTDRLPQLVARLRKENKLVGLAAMCMVDGTVVASGVDGERRKGSGIALEIGDRWHIGSITKSVTATLLARLVEAGKIDWSTTVGSCLDNSNAVHTEWRDVTLIEILTHTSGAPPNFPIVVRLQKPTEGRPRLAARRKAVDAILKDPPTRKPGTKFEYSNVGYTIAAVMAEQTTGTVWEELVRKEVFAPLGLKSAEFGPPKSTRGQLDQPRGHQATFLGKIAAGDKDDNSPIMGPAGSVHMTIEELCLYATEHLRGEQGLGKLLDAETYRVLHTPKRNNYACGWVRMAANQRFSVPMLWHNGSNTMWYALVVFVPERDTVIAVTSNDGDIAKAESAAWEIVEAFQGIAADLQAP